MKTWLIGALIIAFAATVTPTLSDAKRLGGGKNAGMQRDMPARTAPDSAPGKPASPTQAAPATAGAAAAAPAVAAAGNRSWMGPIAGLAAGLGIAALMSHLGMGAAFGNILMMLLLAVAAFFVIRLLMRRFGPKPQNNGMEYAGNAGNAGQSAPTQVAWPAAGGSAQPASVMQPAMPAETLPAPADTVAEPAPVVAALPKAFVPATFDSEGFERVAKMIFIRMQAANDTADLNDLRTFTTPEMFAALRLDLQERGASTQHTDVAQVDAKVLDVMHEAERQIVSVRFTGQLREDLGSPLIDFNETWHLVKPLDDSRSWAIAGIEQAQTQH